jgi:peptidoglycan/xylan/chitin deacetylase (PgdA/CDA1 family)
MKAFAKTLLCATWKYTGLMQLTEFARYRLVGGRLAILLFHRVTDEVPEDGLTVGTERFRAMCRMLRRSFRVVPLAEAFQLLRAGATLPPRTVAITFDDCYRDNLDAGHILAEQRLPACFFIPTGFVGTDRRFEWDRALPQLANLTWDEVRALSQLGFEIGSHSVTHPDMGRLTRAEVRRELSESKDVLEEQLNQPVRWFAYPFGGRNNFRPEWLPLAREVGYEGCVSGYGGFVAQGDDPEMLPREAVPYFQNNLNLELYLSGTLAWYYACKRGGAPGGSPEPVVPPEVLLTRPAEDLGGQESPLPMAQREVP